MSDTLTQDDVQLHTGPTPDKFAHYVKRTLVIDGVKTAEALCGYKWTPKAWREDIPTCPACKAVYDDDEAIQLATGKVRL